MKRLIVMLIVLSSIMASAQTRPVRIVFDVTSKDTLTHQTVVRHVKGMAEMYPGATLEVVIYGGAWPIAVAGGSTTGSTVEGLVKQDNVSFKICALAMEKFGIEKNDLIPGVEVVPDAILEIVGKQQEGWGYIKESHN